MYPKAHASRMMPQNSNLFRKVLVIKCNSTLTFLGVELITVFNYFM